MKSNLYTACYLEKEDKILMLYRNKKENDINEGKWLGVGGHFEPKESPLDCAKREIFEETGYIVNSLKYRGIITFVYDNKEEYIFIFSSDDFSGDQIVCTEGELKWIDRDKILNLNMWSSDYLFMDKIVNKDYTPFMIKAEYDNNGKLIKEQLEL